LAQQIHKYSKSIDPQTTQIEEKQLFDLI